MPWPTPQDYNEAIQNPRQNLADAELAAGTPELTRLGLPRPITGNFASVYRMRCGGKDWAVRCFWREFADMQERYAAISAHLRSAGLPYTVGFDYLARGIKIRGAWYPLLKMEWVQGDLLNEFIASHRDDAGEMRRLAQRWLAMMRALESRGIAHGDLQHGNVLVVGNDFRLVDYDAMFVPALAGRGSHELGHQHYQHPSRAAADYGPWLDRFSGWLIYASIAGVAARPDLWDTLQAGDESMLFRRSDLLNPGSSPAFSRLEALPEAVVQEATQTLKRSLSAPPYRVPPVGGTPVAPTTAGQKGQEGATRPAGSLDRSGVGARPHGGGDRATRTGKPERPSALASDFHRGRLCQCPACGCGWRHPHPAAAAGPRTCGVERGAAVDVLLS